MEPASNLSVEQKTENGEPEAHDETGLVAKNSQQNAEAFKWFQLAPKQRRKKAFLYFAKSQAACKDQLPLRSVGPICTRLCFDCCVFQSCRRKGYADFARRRLRSEPMAVEARDKCPTFKGPAMRTCCKKCNPLEIAQPHWLQSGAPPKIHGATRVDRSAE